jgi:succinate dehydrogenase / fumarate reductase iron-sulfur subunit
MSVPEEALKTLDVHGSSTRDDGRKTVTMKVFRSQTKEGGQFVFYEVPVEEGQVVLDVIHTIQATQAPDLAVRWNCKAGKCGSCSAEVNGKPRLMCMTR